MKDDNKDNLTILIVDEKNSPPPKQNNYNIEQDKIEVLTLDNKQNNYKKILLYIVIIINIVIISIMLLNIYKWYIDNKSTKNEINKINKLITPKNKIDNSKTNKEVNQYSNSENILLKSVNFEKLKDINEDTVGWIKVNGTKINYPIVKTDNNNYYLNHSYNKKVNSAGWIFLDYRNNLDNFSKNTIIYGHGRMNNTMFGSLKQVVQNKWYTNKNNHYINILTPTTNSTWEVFSTYTIEPESYYIKTKFTDNEYLEFLNTLKNRSVYNYNVTLSETDNILTLSSCYNNKKRVVLHAKLITKENY